MPVTEFGGTVYTSMFSFAATVDPASHAAGASVDTTVLTALVKSGDLVVPVPPAAFTAGMAVVGCHTVLDGSFKLGRRTRALGRSTRRLAAGRSWCYVGRAPGEATASASGVAQIVKSLYVGDRPISAEG
jgi:hypothetical protein